MANCDQLPALLDDAKRSRTALDNPGQYCQDQCDPGDIECIRHCLESISQLKEAADQEIASIENEMWLCDALVGSWSLTVTGQFGKIIQGRLSLTGIVSGKISYVQPPPSWLTESDLDGSYDTTHHSIRFTIPSGPVSDGQSYQGSVDPNADPLTMSGTMVEVLPSGESGVENPWVWTAQKM